MLYTRKKYTIYTMNVGVNKIRYVFGHNWWTTENVCLLYCKEPFTMTFPETVVSCNCLHMNNL